jgi:hypothetical protein
MMDETGISRLRTQRCLELLKGFVTILDALPQIPLRFGYIYLRMNLQTVDGSVPQSECLDLAKIRGCENKEIFGQVYYLIDVRGKTIGRSYLAQKIISLVDGYGNPSDFRMRASPDVLRPSQGYGYDLMPITTPEDSNSFLCGIFDQIDFIACPLFSMQNRSLGASENDVSEIFNFRELMRRSLEYLEFSLKINLPMPDRIIYRVIDSIIDDCDSGHSLIIGILRENSSQH